MRHRRIAPDCGAVADPPTGQRPDHAPMRDDGGRSPAAGFRRRAAKGGAAEVKILHGFLRLVPPYFVHAREIERWPVGCQPAGVCPDVAREGRAFPDIRFDEDGNAQPPGDDLGGLQGAGIGARNDSGDVFSRDLRCGSFRLRASDLRERRIVDARSRRVSPNTTLNIVWPCRSRIIARWRQSSVFALYRHRSRTSHDGQSGLRALQTYRPCRISQ